MALTAVSSLMRKHSIHPCSIGRLEVGTESLLDKSKSVKTVLMQLFEPYNTDIEGADTYNACYGGTNAFFNAVNWVESCAWDRRDAIVVAIDIASYADGPMRATGGAGCVAMLIGADAPLAVEPGLRGSHFRHTYDFYKADFSTEYPQYDAPLSLRCYAEAVDACYRTYLQKLDRLESRRDGKDLVSREQTAGDKAIAFRDPTFYERSPSVSSSEDNAGTTPALPVDTFDFMCFHSPTTKVVRKSYARLFHSDYKRNEDHPRYDSVRSKLSGDERGSRLSDADLEKIFQDVSSSQFRERVEPSIFVPAYCGNMYTASVYSALCGMLTLVDSSRLQGKRIGMFSYGSGFASTMYSLRVVGSTEGICEKLDLLHVLAGRKVATPTAWEEVRAKESGFLAVEMTDTFQARSRRSEAYQKASFQPHGSLHHLRPGTYYLEGVDEMFRRTYAVKT
jgi:hydroxymethylglutaryl-CoA synthase